MRAILNSLTKADFAAVGRGKFFPFRHAFHEWLKQSISNAAAADYSSRLGRLDVEVFCQESRDFFMEIPAILMSGASGGDMVVRLLCVYENMVSVEKEMISKNERHLTGFRKPGDIASALTALTAYQEFIISLLDAYEDEPSALHRELKAKYLMIMGHSAPKCCTADLKAFCNRFLTNMMYGRESLVNIFCLRLLTQDRLYGGYKVYFPIRFVNKVLHTYGQTRKEKEGARSWAKGVAADIMVLTGSNPSSYVNVKDIKSLTIARNGAVSCVVNGSATSSRVFTENADGQYVEMKERDITKIAIDHVVPIFNELQDPGAYPGLARLTAVYKGLASECSAEDARPSFKMEALIGKANEMISESERAGLVADLMDELDKMSKIGYRLMSQRENVKKGKKIGGKQ